MEVLDQAERTEVAEEMRRISRDVGAGSRAWRFQVEADRYEKCGREALLLQCEEDHRTFFTKITCKSRICEQCGKSYYGRIGDNFRDLVKIILANKRSGYFCSLLTLTVKKDRFGDRMPNRSDIARFYKESSMFMRLFCGRYKGVWTKTGKVREDRRHWIGAGSVSVVEVGVDNNNLHLHAIVYMPFVPLSVIRSNWKRITGDSHVFRLDRAKNVKHVTNYILKYITKPPAANSYRGLAEYAWMIKGSRRLRSTGMFYRSLVVSGRKRLRCRCPYCSGRLEIAGFVDSVDMARGVSNIWELLCQVESEGKNMSEPVHDPDRGWLDWRGCPLKVPVYDMLWGNRG
jgi:uncharacterized protein with PIN domain